jgi:hypothetical protein
MQQVQKVNDYCTRRENCPKSRRRVGQYVKCNNTFSTCCNNIFSTIEQKNEKKTTINNSSACAHVEGNPADVRCCERAKRHEKCNKHSLFARS